MSVPGIMLENELKKMAGEHGIDKIGWFKSADFPMYLQAVESRKEYSLIKYRSLENFRQAAYIPAQFRTVIVIVADYWIGDDYGEHGLKVADYCRACWPTMGPKTEIVLDFLRKRGLKAESLDLPARASACLAGLGFIGKNTMFYADNIGSYVGIITIGVDIELKEGGNGTERVCHSGCAKCSRCVKACPARAIDENGYGINPLRCISMLNRHPDEPAGELPSSGKVLDRWLLGCEKCQEVCPLNRKVRHKRNVVVVPELKANGMMIPNTAGIPVQLVREQLNTITSPGYRRYVAKLLGES